MYLYQQYIRQPPGYAVMLCEAGDLLEQRHPDADG